MYAIKRYQLRASLNNQYSRIRIKTKVVDENGDEHNRFELVRETGYKTVSTNYSNTAAEYGQTAPANNETNYPTLQQQHTLTTAD